MHLNRIAVQSYTLWSSLSEKINNITFQHFELDVWE